MSHVAIWRPDRRREETARRERESSREERQNQASDRQSEGKWCKSAEKAGAKQSKNGKGRPIGNWRKPPEAAQGEKARRRGGAREDRKEKTRAGARAAAGEALEGSQLGLTRGHKVSTMSDYIL